MGFYQPKSYKVFRGGAWVTITPPPEDMAVKRYPPRVQTDGLNKKTRTKKYRGGKTKSYGFNK